MLLVADVGNTHVHLGLYEGERLVARHTFSGEQVLDMDAAWEAFATRAPGGADALARIDGACLCSVSPKTKIPLMHWLGRRLGARPEVVGESLAYPMPVNVDDPGEVGPDRVVNAFAAWRLLGRGPLVVVDFGTAITLDVVDAGGAYIGGVIAPGATSSARALATQTALLPYVRVQPVVRAIGRNTMDAIMGGLFFGLIGMVEAMCAQVASELDTEPLFVATGGDAALFAERSAYLADVRPDLTLLGLRLIWEEARARRG